MKVKADFLCTNISVVEFPLYLKSVGQVLNFALLRLECPDTKSNMLIKRRRRPNFEFVIRYYMKLNYLFREQLYTESSGKCKLGGEKS